MTDRTVSIHGDYSLALGDYVRATVVNAAASLGNAALGSAFLAMGISLLMLGNSSGWIGVVLGTLLITGVHTVPFVWWAVRRRADLLLSRRQLSVDDQGIRIVTPTTNVEQTWPTFRAVREVRDGFMLDYGTGVLLLIPKRAFGAGDVAAFRGLADRAGKLDTSPRWRPALIGLFLGAGIVIGGLLIIANLA